MRFVLAITVALANAAGPWLCCCVLATTAHPSATAEPPVLKKSPAKCSHCCEEPVPTEEPKPQPAKPCPCQERVTATPIAVPPMNDATAVAGGIADGFLLPVAIPDVPGVLVAVPPVSGWPFLTAEVRIHVHHAMRC